MARAAKSRAKKSHATKPRARHPSALPVEPLAAADAAALRRIAAALERLAPVAPPSSDLGSADVFVWEGGAGYLRAATRIARVDLTLLRGIDSQRDILLANTRQFARRLSANNALLWGAKGMGKSSLIKAVHATVNGEVPGSLALVELHRDDIGSLSALLTQLADSDRRCIVFCDDLSFDASGGDSARDGAGYRSLKAMLEGGIEGRPDNVVLYATSNRRHMVPRDMIENESATAIRPTEAVDEKVSLSDRFGLWIGFHPGSQDDYFAMVEGYAKRYRLKVPIRDLRAQAVEWSMTRGARSGRVAWQFIQDLAGRLGKTLR